MSEEIESLIARKFREGTPIDRALVRAVRKAIERHRRLGESICTLRDGKVVWIPPEEIPEYKPEEEP